MGNNLFILIDYLHCVVFFSQDNRTPGWCLSETYLKFGMNPREDNVWTPDDTYYCKLIGRLVDNILHKSASVAIWDCYCSCKLPFIPANKKSWASGVPE